MPPVIAMQHAVGCARRLLGSQLHVLDVAEEAYFNLVLMACQGRRPDHPQAWLGKVVRNLVARRARDGRLRVQFLDIADDPPCASDAATAPTSPWGAERREHLDAMTPLLRPRLTRRQATVLDQIRHCTGMRALARATGMSPKDVRDVLRSIAKKARVILATAPGTSAG